LPCLDTSVHQHRAGWHVHTVYDVSTECRTPPIVLSHFFEFAFLNGLVFYDTTPESKKNKVYSIYRKSCAY